MSDPIITLPAFENFAGVTAFFTTRIGGFSSSPYHSLNLGYHTQDIPDNIHSNWNKLAEQYKLDLTRIKKLKQVHSDIIQNADVPEKEDLPEGDSLYTREPGNILTVFTADCLPVLIYDPVKNSAAAVHAGWRGTRKNILRKTLELLKHSGLIEKTSVQLSLGPCISQSHYEVGAEVAENFKSKHIIIKNNVFKLDLVSANLEQIQDFGIPGQNVSVAGHCTFRQTDKYFSHRKEGPKTGRMAALIKLA